MAPWEASSEQRVRSDTAQPGQVGVRSAATSDSELPVAIISRRSNPSSLPQITTLVTRARRAEGRRRSSNPPVVDNSLLPPWRGGNITRLEVATEYSAMHLIIEGLSSGFFLSTSPDMYFEAPEPEFWTPWLYELPNVFPQKLTTVLLARIRLDRAADTIVSLLRCTPQVEELDITFPISHDVRPPSEGADSLDHSEAVTRPMFKDTNNTLRI
ncbi:hypothetical protein C8Q76DRAFT_792553 [Earliella scabrosa]|nr:hypothetical protein C8Q76DRAFT_792553 [Earliella scabrosa]